MCDQQIHLVFSFTIQYYPNSNDPSSIQGTFPIRTCSCIQYGLALHGFSVAQWIERPPGVWEVIGLNPVEDLDFSLCPMLMTFADYFIFTMVTWLDMTPFKKKMICPPDSRGDIGATTQHML